MRLLYGLTELGNGSICIYGDLAALPEHGVRQVENVMRLAGSWHAFEKLPGEIGGETVARAAEFVRWHTEHYKLRFMPEPTVPREFQEAERLEHWLRWRLQRTGAWDIRRDELRTLAPNIGLSKASLERALMVLCTSLRTQVVVGEHRTVWVALNPHFFGTGHQLT